MRQTSGGKIPAAGRNMDALLSQHNAGMVSSRIDNQHLTCHGTRACSNVVEFYYPEEMALFEREFIEAEQAAYRETAVEDDEICTTNELRDAALCMSRG